MWWVVGGALLLPLTASAAAVEFTHIEYDPEGSDKGREWVRILNTSGSPLDLTGWKFVEGGVNHNLKALNVAIVPAGSHAVIADDGATYAAEHPGEIVFDSAFSLSNTGEAVALADPKKVVVVSKTYTVEKKEVAKKVKSKEVPQIAAPVAAAPPPEPGWGIWPWVAGLAALVVVAGGALFLIPREKRSGYEIISEHD